ncbi:MAG: ABC transporter permease [Oscillospiraceae bacterium]|nr:ABC transporter permease [Oscillospiraceae bacterium]
MIKNEQAKTPILSRVGNFVMEYLVLLTILALVAVTIVIEREFATQNNLTNLMRQFGSLSFVALGMTFVILGGFIDLSVPGMISLVAMVTLSLVDTIGEIPAMLVGLALGTTLGVINGTILVTSGANTQAKALFITFGMSQIYRSIALQYTGGFSMNWGILFEHPMPVTRALGTGMLGPFSISFWLFLFFLAVLFVFQTRTYLGRSITYTGGNILAAELGGIHTKKIMIFIYGLCGFMVAVGSIVEFSRVSVTVPAIGDFFERNAIMAVVVGGTSLLGGKGSVVRTFIGVSLVILMSNCMNLMGVQTHLQEVVRGAILVIAIWLDHRRHAKS